MKNWHADLSPTAISVSHFSSQKIARVRLMISAKEAVHLAVMYMNDIYSDSIQGLNVEELSLDQDTDIWNVTMGYWEFLPVPPDVLQRSALPFATRKVRRAYKELQIHAKSGQVLSMKIRVVPAPESSQ